MGRRSWTTAHGRRGCRRSKEVAKRDKLLAMLNPKLGVSGAMTMNIGDLTLDSTSIKNYLAAINEAFASETTSAATNFEALANGMPVGLPYATYGLFGLDYAGAVEELRKNMADALAEEKNAAVINAAAKLLPSIAAAIASGDYSGASKAVLAFVTGLGEDLGMLSPEAKQAALDMINAFDLSTLDDSIKEPLIAALVQITTSTGEFAKTFGDGADYAMEMFKGALSSGTLKQADFTRVIGASSSKEALAALAVTMATEGNTATNTGVAPTAVWCRSGAFTARSGNA